MNKISIAIAAPTHPAGLFALVILEDGKVRVSLDISKDQAVVLRDAMTKYLSGKA